LQFQCLLFHRVIGKDAEKVLLDAANDNLKMCILRTGNIYLPTRKLKTQTLAIAGRKVPLDGDSGAMLIHCDDVVRACDFALKII
jgi:nucleoside-diphosphate-sugar epimerase